jgi:hypothetical protein
VKLKAKSEDAGDYTILIFENKREGKLLSVSAIQPFEMFGSGGA